MAKTAAQIAVELRLYECCIADLAYKYIKKEKYGIQGINCLLSKVTYAVELLDGLTCYSTIIDREYLSQQEYEDELEKLNELCGCQTCKTSEQIEDDTI